MWPSAAPANFLDFSKAAGFAPAVGLTPSGRDPMRILTVLLALSFLIPGLTAAQEGLRGFELNAGVAGWSGDDFEGLDPGLRIQASALGGVSDALTLGFTATWAPVGSEEETTDVTEIGFGGTARFLLGAGQGLFLEGYAGWTRLAVELGAEDGLELQSNGLAVGPGVGVMVPMGAARLVIGADLRYHTYDGLRFSGGSTIGELDRSGWRWAADVGLLIG